jgi:hypothetical protein
MIGPYSGQINVCYLCHPEYVGIPQPKFCLCREEIQPPGPMYSEFTVRGVEHALVMTARTHARTHACTHARTRAHDIRPHHLRHLGVEHVLVVVDDDVGEREHVAREEVGAPAALAPKLPQVLQRALTHA